MEQKNHLLVSVIINNYNYGHFLPESVDSALNQTYPNVEVIVVDDCSTDNSQEVITSYGDKIIPIFHQVNGKQAAAFNSGFAKSQGDIIIFLDSDDYLYPYAVERVVLAWKQNIAKVHYRLTVVDKDRKPLGFSYPQGGKPLDSGEVWRNVITEGTYAGVPTSGNAISRKSLTQVFPIPDEYKTMADDYLSVLIPLYGEVVAIEEPLAAYRIHTSNQWALFEVTAARFRRFVQHGQQRCKLLAQKAPELGYEVPQNLDLEFSGRVWFRLASLRLDPQEHPIPSDNALSLIYWGIRSQWKSSDANFLKRLIYSLGFIWVGLMPLPLAKTAIIWLFAPQFRPKILNKVLKVQH